MRKALIILSCILAVYGVIGAQSSAITDCKRVTFCQTSTKDKLPMIAARDIGFAAAEALLRLDFGQQQTRELLGRGRIRPLARGRVTAEHLIGPPSLKQAEKVT